MSTSPATQDRSLALAVVTAADRQAARPLWPNFDPRLLPLALYDEQQRWLVRHPDPSPEYAPVAGRLDVVVSNGLHASVRANTSAMLQGPRTATVMDPIRHRPLADDAVIQLRRRMHLDEPSRRYALRLRKVGGEAVTPWPGASPDER